MHQDSLQTVAQPIAKPLERDLRLKTMRVSVLEGSFATIMYILGDSFYVPYLTALGASTLQVAFGVSLPFLFSSVIQLLGPLFIRFAASRRRVMMISATGQALCYIPLGLAWYLADSIQVWPAIAAYTLACCIGNLSASAWSDLIGTVVPRRRRGSYFATRTRLHSFIQMVAAIIAGRLLDYAAGKVLLMFTAIWITCSAMRLLSGTMFLFHWDPPIPPLHRRLAPGFIDFIKSLPSSGFGIFTLALALVNFGAYMSGPFFAIHMISNLKWSYFQYSFMIMVPVAAMVIMLGIWGRVIDKFNSATVLRFCSLGLCLIPLPWVLTDSYWLLLLTYIFSGFCWGGINLAAFTYFTASLKADQRIQYIAYYTSIVFFSIFAGTLLGGFIEPILPQVARFQIQSIFLASALIRIIPAMILQALPAEAPHKGRISAIERFFFDPKLPSFSDLAAPALKLVRRISS